MALEQQPPLEKRLEHPFYVTSGNAFEEIKLSQSILARPYECTIEPDQQPFFVKPTQLYGYTKITDGQPFRKVLVSLTPCKGTGGYKTLGPGADAIKPYDTTVQALDDISLRDLPQRRENMQKLIAGLDQATCLLHFTGSKYSGALSFSDGQLVAVYVTDGHEVIRNVRGLVAFGALAAHQPLTFTTEDLDHNSMYHVGAGINARPAADLSAIIHAISQRLERNQIGNLVFNVHEQNGRAKRMGSPDYGIGIAFGGITAGLLRFANNSYVDGKFGIDGTYALGDRALGLAVAAATSNDAAFTFKRVDVPRVLSGRILDGRATRSALHTVVETLTPAGL